jgi:hypothetical protein
MYKCVGEVDIVARESHLALLSRVCRTSKSKRQMGAPNMNRTYVVSLPGEAQELLAENGMDLVSVLHEQGLIVQATSLPEDLPNRTGEKEILLMLIGVALTAQALAAAISKVLDALARNKKFLVTESDLLPVLNDSGEPVKNTAGEPITYWSERKRILEPSRSDQDKTKTELELKPTLLKFSIESGG